MGDRNFFDRAFPALFQKDEVAEREAELAAKRLREQRLAEQTIAHEQAWRECPEDVKDFGRRHGIPNFAEVVWLNGYMAGYKQAQRDRQAALARTEDGGRNDG